MKITLKTFVIFSIQIILLLIIIPFSASVNRIKHRIKSVECSSFDNKSLSADFCYIKAYSRKLTTLNMKFNFHRKFSKPFYIQYIIGRKTSGNDCQNLFKSDFIEVCGLMDGLDANPLIKNIIHVMNETAPQLFQKCPYDGELIVTNATFQIEKGIIAFPTGTYCTETNVFDDKKRQVLVVKLTFEIMNGFNFFGLLSKNT